MEILSRDDVWDKRGDTDNESEPKSKKRKIDEASSSLSDPHTSKTDMRRSSAELERDMSDSEDDDDDDATIKGSYFV